jgi:hypothetical protein
MVYGYQNYTAKSLDSILFSLILYLGCCILGYCILKLKIFNSIKKNNYFYLHSPLVFLNFLLLILFPLSNLELLNFLTLKLISNFIFLFGIIALPLIIVKFNFKLIKNIKILTLLIIAYSLISLSPITHADSLAYHLNAAVYLLNYGKFIQDIIPIESQLSGAGEILIALGLSQGASQFSNLIQLSSILSIISVFYNVDQKFLSKQNHYLLLSILTAPLFILLISSPKPQILSITNVLWIFSIIFIFFKDLNKKKLVFFYIFTSLILAVNFMTKFSFIISSLILFIYSSYYLFRKNLYFQIIIVPLLIFFIFVFPSFLFKHKYYGVSLFEFFISPLPINIFGYKNVIDIIKGPITFPTWVIYPSNFTDLSTIIGPAFLTFLLIKFSDLKKNYFFFIIIFIYITITIIFGSSISRFIFDSFLIIQFILIFCRFRSINLFNNYKKFIFAQTIIAFCIIIYFVIRLLPGSINNTYYNNVMLKNANGYELIMWSNKFLTKDDKIISTHRSVSLFNVEAIEYWTLKNINFYDTRSQIYSDLIKLKKINRILFYNNNQDDNIFKNCTGKLLAKKSNVGNHVGRNPFTKGMYYDAAIYELRYDLMPKCIVSR